MDWFSDGRYDDYMDSLVNRCYYNLKSLIFDNVKLKGKINRKTKVIVTNIEFKVSKEFLNMFPKNCLNCVNCKKECGMNLCSVYQAMDEYCVIKSSELETMANDCDYYEDKEETA